MLVEAKMGGRRQTVMVGFAVALLLGVGVYLRIWSIDSSFTADDREILRQQFERANLEAMDESAEWRMKYDGEVDRSRQFQEELLKVKASLAASTKRVSDMQKKYITLQKEMKSLKETCKCKEA
ncbi:acyl-CoA-binding domain protein [Rhynchospora pubera]|uniref:Acyl-CoA-binding domain protein n=1 Tax=Rhynchospora pubera TaxID=906938 RepID=A0AAV8ED33_9POAL|nr:acyl-CoA-binding domain protein [Rhynchospora pubera]KAJ4776318.1 acyl-CoA-binding domain protein [Rhynchospora pubera]KAJ4802444.1 acyl-CoA-binding domain protein [Rhynchospora pubera]